MTTQTETRQFEAEVQQLLGLMIHSLYKERDIFLRELISNASDALDKVRFEALTQPDLLAEGEELEVRLEVDRDEGTLTVRDNGIGMSREELVANLGTIASSGTKKFLEELQSRGADAAPELIGQFGVGFYSSFMVADEVVVETRRAGDDQGYRWRSKGDGEYSIEEIDREQHGTSVTLKLRAADEEADERDYFADWVLHDIVRRYSDFVEYPIRMEVERSEPVLDDEGKPVEGAEPEKKLVVETLNSMKPLWLRDKQEISEDEYAEFYKHLTHDWNPPLSTLHFKVEGTSEYTALLYVPSERPFDLFDAQHNKSRVSLYVKRVFIMDDCEELLPSWLRFMRGLVDAHDLPLNVSRETLQNNRNVRQMRSRLERKVLDMLARLKKDEREKYEKFWEQFGMILKEGIYYGENEDDRISWICLFQSTRGEEWTSLDEYVERMPEGQKAIYTIAGNDRKVLEDSPALEGLRAKGYEVLLLTDPVDEWWLPRLREYEDHPVVSVERGELDLEDEGDKAEREARAAEFEGLLKQMNEALAGGVSEVRFSTRLTDSPAVLVTEANAPSPQMARMMAQMRGSGPESKRVLEVNPNHAILQRMKALHEAEPGSERIGRFTELLYGQALLAEGSPLSDPARFSKLLTELMVSAD